MVLGTVTVTVTVRVLDTSHVRVFPKRYDLRRIGVGDEFDQDWYVAQTRFAGGSVPGHTRESEPDMLFSAAGP